MFKKNPQGFTIINLSRVPVHSYQQIDACMVFEFHGFEISISTGGSVLSGGCLVEHLVTDPEGRDHYVEGTVQDAIEFVLNRVNKGE